jgi:hypothetical protein
VHFHDIFYPFEYPKEWIYEARAWTEAYLLRAFLTFNRAYEIVLFNTFLERFHRDRLCWQLTTRCGGSLVANAIENDLRATLRNSAEFTVLSWPRRTAISLRSLPPQP